MQALLRIRVFSTWIPAKWRSCHSSRSAMTHRGLCGYMSTAGSGIWLGYRVWGATPCASPFGSLRGVRRPCRAPDHLAELMSWFGVYFASSIHDFAKADEHFNIIFMCGICGVVGVEHREEAEAVVRRMMAAMQHRGPDDEGLLVAPPGAPSAALGMRRLSIIDLAGGHQPVF